MRECDWIGAPVRVGWFQWHCIHSASDGAFTLPCCCKADALGLEEWRMGLGSSSWGFPLVFIKPELLEWSCVILGLLWHFVQTGPVLVCVSSGFLINAQQIIRVERWSSGAGWAAEPASLPVLILKQALEIVTLEDKWKCHQPHGA